MVRVPTRSRLFAPEYAEMIVACRPTQWQLQGSEFAFWPVEEPYPPALEFEYGGETYQAMIDPREGEDTITIRILVSSSRNAALKLLGVPTPFLYVLRDGIWKSVGVQYVTPVSQDEYPAF
ncbi:MAG: hypothetical protein WBP12_04605 [Candidatus Saccharimonas sp.]